MSTAAVTRPTKNVAVTVIGVITTLWGAAHAVLGVWLTVAGDSLLSAARRPDNQHDPGWFFALLLWVFGAIAAVLGVASLLQGGLGLLAGVGVLGRRQWGRVLTFLVGVLAILWGLLWLSAYNQGATYVAVGAAQTLYGLFAVVVLARHGEEFSRPRV